MATHLRCSVAHLLRTMSAQEFAQWLAWLQLRAERLNPPSESDKNLAQMFGGADG